MTALTASGVASAAAVAARATSIPSEPSDSAGLHRLCATVLQPAMVAMIDNPVVNAADDHQKNNPGAHVGSRVDLRAFWKRLGAVCGICLMVVLSLSFLLWPEAEDDSGATADLIAAHGSPALCMDSVCCTDTEVRVVQNDAAENSSAGSACTPRLPLPARRIPDGIVRPGGRSSVHGWLWLPTDNHGQALADPNVCTTQGYFYHHTPEFWQLSEHNFELMVGGTLSLDNCTAWASLPIPPAAPALDTEYVFTPPTFGLDDLISGEVDSFRGRFTKGSFDTPQVPGTPIIPGCGPCGEMLSMATLSVTELPTVHYLWDLENQPMPQQAYLSYPRRDANEQATGQNVVDLYWVHVLWSAPDYDQVVHVTLDVDSCQWSQDDSVEHALAVGATFATRLTNDVSHRLHTGVHSVSLLTEQARDQADQANKTTCLATVVKEIHCVTMPDSFARCPPL